MRVGAVVKEAYFPQCNFPTAWPFQHTAVLLTLLEVATTHHIFLERRKGLAIVSCWLLTYLAWYGHYFFVIGFPRTALQMRISASSPLHCALPYLLRCFSRFMVTLRDRCSEHLASWRRCEIDRKTWSGRILAEFGFWQLFNLFRNVDLFSKAVNSIWMSIYE